MSLDFKYTPIATPDFQGASNILTQAQGNLKSALAKARETFVADPNRRLEERIAQETANDKDALDLAREEAARGGLAGIDAWENGGQEAFIKDNIANPNRLNPNDLKKANLSARDAAEVYQGKMNAKAMEDFTRGLEIQVDGTVNPRAIIEKSNSLGEDATPFLAMNEQRRKAFTAKDNEQKANYAMGEMNWQANKDNISLNYKTSLQDKRLQLGLTNEGKASVVTDADVQEAWKDTKGLSKVITNLTAKNISFTNEDLLAIRNASSDETGFWADLFLTDLKNVSDADLAEEFQKIQVARKSDIAKRQQEYLNYSLLAEQERNMQLLQNDQNLVNFKSQQTENAIRRAKGQNVGYATFDRINYFGSNQEDIEQTPEPLDVTQEENAPPPPPPPPPPLTDVDQALANASGRQGDSILSSGKVKKQAKAIESKIDRLEKEYMRQYGEELPEDAPELVEIQKQRKELLNLSAEGETRAQNFKEKRDAVDAVLENATGQGGTDLQAGIDAFKGKKNYRYRVRDVERNVLAAALLVSEGKALSPDSYKEINRHERGAIKRAMYGVVGKPMLQLGENADQELLGYFETGSTGNVKKDIRVDNYLIKKLKKARMDPSELEAIRDARQAESARKKVVDKNAKIQDQIENLRAMLIADPDSREEVDKNIRTKGKIAELEKGLEKLK